MGRRTIKVWKRDLSAGFCKFRNFLPGTTTYNFLYAYNFINYYNTDCRDKISLLKKRINIVVGGI